MKPKTIVLLDSRDSGWYGFLGEYFEDSASCLHYCYETLQMGSFLDHHPPDIVFVNNEVLNRSLVQKLKLCQESNSNFRIFHLGEIKKPIQGLIFDDNILEPLEFSSFQKHLVQHLPLPEKIKVLVIDDEAEIGQMLRDYSENRTDPSFYIHYVSDGHKGLDLLSKESFDVIVLDVKMPVVNGREVYRQIKARGITVPVIIFFDAIFGDEIVDIYQYGRPAVVEKGSRISAMPEMISLLKKMVYFG